MHGKIEFACPQFVKGIGQSCLSSAFPGPFSYRQALELSHGHVFYEAIVNAARRLLLCKT